MRLRYARGAIASTTILGTAVFNARPAKSRYASLTLHITSVAHPSCYKCDEEKPKCRSCTRRNRSCNYANNAGLNQLARAAQESSPYQSSEPGSTFASVPYNHGHGGSIPSGNHNLKTLSPVPMAPPSPLSLNMAHLHLLHHFTAVTSEALGLESISREAWKLTIPHIALSHDFLMHSILGLAALHIAHLQLEQRLSYWERAVLHQDRAVELQQEAMANACPYNADALYSFSLLVVYSAFATLKVSCSQESRQPLAGVIQCIDMIRGIRYVVPPVQRWVEEGPLAKLLVFNPTDVQSNHSFNDVETDRYFQRFLVLCSTSSDTNKSHDFEDIGLFAAAASTLRASFLKIESMEGDLMKTPPIWHWACRLTPEFVQKLRKQHPIPLVLVAHWCVIVSQIHQYWWIQGWVDHTMGQVRENLAQEYHEWLEWPTKKIGKERQKWIAAGIVLS